MNPVKVVKKEQYYCTVATRVILKGETVLKLDGAVSSIPNKYSLQIGEKKHLYAFSEDPADESSAFRFLNHSCSPNCYFDMTHGTLVALRDIAANEEINFHYCATEYEMTSPFECLCGSARCLKEIKGYKFLSEADKISLKDQLAPHLKQTEVHTS